MNFIHNILYNNSYPIQPVKTPKTNKKYTTNSDLEIPKQKWVTFTYTGKKTTFLTKIFKRSKLKIAYCTNNSIQRNLNPKNSISNKYLVSGIYKLTCTDCGKAYVGQMGRKLLQRYKEHLRAFRNNISSSKFTQHLNDHIYTFGPIDDTMQILYHQKKGTHHNTIERFYIHKEALSYNHLHDTHTHTLFFPIGS
jgi:hypothetical protein